MLYLDPDERLIGVVALDIAGGQVRGINSIVNPDKLTHLGPLGDLTSLLCGEMNPVLSPPRRMRLFLSHPMFTSAQGEAKCQQTR